MTLAMRLAVKRVAQEADAREAPRETHRFALVTRKLAPKGVTRTFTDRNGTICCELKNGKVRRLTTLVRGR